MTYQRLFSRKRAFWEKNALIDDRVLWPKIVAMEDTGIIIFNKDDLLQYFSKGPKFAARFLNNLFEKERHEERQEKPNKITMPTDLSQIERMVSSQIQVSKDIFDRIENRTAKTVDHVEKGWRVLSSIIYGVVGFFTLVGFGLTFLGVKEVRNIYQTSNEVQNIKNDVIEIKNNMASEYKFIHTLAEDSKAQSDDTKFLKETNLVIDNVSRNFLESNLSSINDEELYNANIIYERAYNDLYHYLKEYQDYESRVVIKAFKNMLFLKKLAKYH